MEKGRDFRPFFILKGKSLWLASLVNFVHCKKVFY